ncbi:MAG: sn-glycerol-3-phosphate ABC transporter ATP-binding protein UgpC [Rhizobiaceae bacterium]|nr:sn-glycerol-3-phosphate ABC transporter ATP-binding protein UgpC [Rhizobiaceae bacterium]MCV0408202.1 sn-glycerol-3-phosphate ABC transporter ATP-binding protein UgpC [Rhizobiaceae bacterium]
MAKVELRGVVKRFGAVEVVHGIDLEIADREFVVLVGPSGCGKSTLLRMIAGLEGISEGEIEIDGRVVNELAPKDRDIAMVFQDYALYPHLDVYRNMAFALEVRGMKKDEIRPRVEKAAKILDIGHLLERRPAQLSGGQRQRVAMGRAIVRDPKVFLFDEPLSNLDAKLRADMRTEIKTLHRTVDTTVIYVTHDQVEAMTLAQRIVVMRGGHVEQIGTPDEVYSFPSTLFVAGFIGAPRMNQVPCRLSDDGRAVLVASGPRIDLGTRCVPSDLAGKELVLGLRPEAITLAGEGDGDAFEAEIHMVEPLGSDTLTFFRLGGAEVIARLPPLTSLKEGARIRVAVDHEKMHLFDAETEKLIDPRA